MSIRQNMSKAKVIINIEIKERTNAKKKRKNRRFT